MSWLILAEIATALAKFFIIIIFFKALLNVKNNNKWAYVLSASIFAITSAISNYYLNVLFSCAINIALCFAITFLFRSNIKSKLFSVILLVIFLVSANLAAAITIANLSRISTPVVYYEYNSLLIETIISKLILLVFVKTFIMLKKSRQTHISVNYWALLLIIPAISALTLFIVFDWKIISSTPRSSAISLISAIGLLFVNIITFRFFDFFREKANMQTKEKTLLQYIDLQTAQYNTAQKEYNEKRAAMHDFAKHINIINEMLTNLKSADALCYVSKLAENIIPSKNHVHTGNSVVDTIFNSKITQAKNLGIKVKLDNIFIPADLPMNASDLVVVFANAWENAIEACEKVINRKKIIEVGLVCRDERLVFKLINSTSGITIRGKNNMSFKTSKKDYINHGFGIENIKRTVAKYNGLADFKHNGDKGMFELTIIIRNI